ncbi:hypothetical protein YC2023_103831 [Brassica napus]
MKSKTRVFVLLLFLLDIYRLSFVAKTRLSDGLGEMALCYWKALLLLLLLSCLFSVSYSSLGDADPNYRACVGECEISGCVGQLCFPQCNSSSNTGPWYTQEPLCLQWQKWGCQGDCRYHCMVNRERERETLGQPPLKYHGYYMDRVNHISNYIKNSLDASIMNEIMTQSYLK